MNFISRGKHIWHECQANIWSSNTKTFMRLIITQHLKIYSMYRTGEVSVHRACCERATQPYSLRVGVQFIQAQDQQLLRSPRMITECLLTRSILIKMYLPLHGICRICILYLQSVNFMQMLTQSIWSFKLHKCFCLTQQFYQKAWI